MNHLTRSLALLFLVVFVVGCGGGAEGDDGRVATYETTGKITFEGKPVADAVVTFSPKGTQPPAIGRTGSDGTYSLRTYEEGDGAAAGDYTVLVSKTAVASTSGPAPHDPNNAGPAAHGGRSAAETKSELPEKYNSQTTSDLQATVKDGDNNFDFDLKK